MKKIKKIPIITFLTIFLCIIIFVFQIHGDVSMDKYANIPFLSLHGQYYRLLTAGFLHLDISHIASNVLMLLIIGEKLESFGKTRFLITLILSILCANIISALFYSYKNAFIMSVGISGGIFGLVGAMIAYSYNNNFKVYSEGLRNYAYNIIIANAFFNIINKNIDVASHIGGLFVGFVVMAILLKITDFMEEFKK